MRMPDEPDASRRIDAALLDWVEVSADGRRLRLRLSDAAGHAASVSLPVESLNAMITALPRTPGIVPDGAVHRLDGWSLREQDEVLLLTLRRPDGVATTFAVKPWQLAAIASLAGAEGGGRGRPN